MFLEFFFFSIKETFKAISHSGGYFFLSFIPLNGSPMQNRVFKTSEKDGDGHTLCPPDGAQLGNVCELQKKHERALFC